MGPNVTGHIKGLLKLVQHSIGEVRKVHAGGKLYGLDKGNDYKRFSGLPSGRPWP